MASEVKVVYTCDGCGASMDVPTLQVTAGVDPEDATALVTDDYCATCAESLEASVVRLKKKNGREAKRTKRAVPGRDGAPPDSSKLTPPAADKAKFLPPPTDANP